jgi:pilus assembly protein CpaB
MSFKGTKYVVLAVVVGLLAVFAVNRAFSSKATAAQPVSQVVIAETDITSGTPLSPRLLKAVAWPRQIVPSQAIASVEQINGRVVNVPLTKGEPVLLSKLAPEGTAAGLGGLLKEEMRAFTVKVDDVSGVAGFVHPGDHVDIVMTLPVIDNNKGEQISKTILQDIKVLTAGQLWQANSQNEPKTVNTVTLEVSPEQSEILNLASTQGKIRLTLRSRVNREIKKTAGVLTSSLINGHGPEQHEKANTSAPAPTERVVEVIKGMAVSSKKL